MTEYFILWLSVFVFIGIGILTNMLFFRSENKRIRVRIGRRGSLDNMLFEHFRR